MKFPLIIFGCLLLLLAAARAEANDGFTEQAHRIHGY